MPSLQQVVLASALLGLSSAVPTPSRHFSSSSFKISMIPKANSQFKTGAALYSKALRKFGGNADHIASVAEAAVSVHATVADPSTVVATPDDYDLEYTCPVTIGSQTFTLDFDTGSSDLWVLSNSISTKNSAHTYYTPSGNASRQSGSSWKISYGDGSSASGSVYLDTVTIGETTVSGQAVEAATTASSTFTSASSEEDGLLGLGFDSINTVSPTPAKTFFTNAVAQGLSQAVFTALLKKGEPGSYTFGEIDTSQYTGDITYTDVDSSQGFWTFSPSSYAIGGQTGSASASALTGIADTGTTLLLLDDSIVQAYYAQVDSAQDSTAAGGYVFDCSATLPDFSVDIGGYTATVPGSFIDYAPNGDGTCYGGIQSSGSIGFNIYGDIFLKSQFVVFDQTQSTPRLGFAAQA